MLNGAQILSGATTSFTGGTVYTLTADGKQVKNGVHLVNAAITDYATRPNYFLEARQPVYDPSTKSYSNWKKSAKGYRPKVDAVGNIKAPSWQIILSDNPCQTTAEVDAMKAEMIQFIQDSDFASFWSVGTLA